MKETKRLPGGIVKVTKHTKAGSKITYVKPKSTKKVPSGIRSRKNI